MAYNFERLTNYITKMDGKIVLGIDGIIDQVWQVVDKRQDKNTYSTVDKLFDFGSLITDRKTGGLGKEILNKRRTSGGFVANTGRAVGNLSLDTTLLGLFGEKEIEPVFHEFIDTCKIVSLGKPVLSNIFEFTDGKLMLTNSESIISFTWEDLVSKIGNEKVNEIFGDADVVCLGYWSNMHDFNNILTKLVDETVSVRTKRIFFDFANIAKRSDEALKTSLKLIAELNKKIPMTLSLNEHEGALFLKFFGLDTDINNDIENKLKIMAEKAGLDEVIIHSPEIGVGYSQTVGFAKSTQITCECPIRTTGAGDTFNGGYISSLLQNVEPLSFEERLLMANAATAYYVRNGNAATREQLAAEIERYK